MTTFMEISQWGRTGIWSDGQGSDLNFIPVERSSEQEGEQVWTPVWNDQSQEWQIGFEWDMYRDIQSVCVSFRSKEDNQNCRNLKLEYWNHNWPSFNPERLPGARRGWIGTDDLYHGIWVTVRGEMKEEGLSRSFLFDPLDIVEIPRVHDLEWSEDFNVMYRRTLKLRLSFQSRESIPVRIQALSTAQFIDEKAEIRFGCLSEEDLDWSGNIAIFNGKLISVDSIGFSEQDEIKDAAWNCRTQGSVKGIALSYKKSIGSKAFGDQTQITVKTNTRSFTFLCEDLEQGPIWIKDYNVLISKPLPNGEWRKEVDNASTGEDSIYDRVPGEKEQTYERAVSEIPPLDVTRQAPFGRYTILGWEGVRQEWALRYNGEVFADKSCLKLSGRDASKIRWAGNEIHFRFATGDPVDFHLNKTDCSQRMLEPEIPVYITQWLDREIEYTQTAFAALLQPTQRDGLNTIKGNEDIVGMLRFRIRNTTEGKKKALLWLNLSPAEQLVWNECHLFSAARVIPAETVKEGWKLDPYECPRLRCSIDLKGKGQGSVVPLSCGTSVDHAMKTERRHRENYGKPMPRLDPPNHIANTFLYEIELEGHSSHEIDVAIPFPSFTQTNEITKIAELFFDEKLEEVSAYWKSFHAKAATFEIPDPVINDFIKTVPWHIVMTADRDPGSGNDVVPAATYSYGACGNEACMQIRLLDMLGYHDYAEKYLDTFIHTQGVKKPDGNFSSKEGAFVAVDFDDGEVKNSRATFAYNLDHGFIMSCFADHYFLSGDKDWLINISNNLLEACRFVLRERKRTMQVDENGNKAAYYGLMPPGHLEDNVEWQYWFAVNAQAHGGMERICRAFHSAGLSEWQGLAEEIKEYKQDILHAVEYAMVHSPVVRLLNGAYIPHLPTRASLRGRDWGWFREAAYGPLHLVDGLVLNPKHEKVTWILQDLEDNLFVSRQYGRPVDLEKHWFSQGGVTIQANLLNNGPAYLLREQPAHAVRALYNNFAQHIYPDVLVFTEHPVIELGHGVGPFFKTSDESQFLVWLRSYLICESNQELWLCKGAPRSWFESGKRIEIKNAATAFGKLTFSVESGETEKCMQANIFLNQRIKPSRLHLCLRNTEGKSISRVIVNGKEHVDYDSKKEVIHITDPTSEIQVKAYFE